MNLLPVKKPNVKKTLKNILISIFVPAVFIPLCLWGCSEKDTAVSRRESKQLPQMDVWIFFDYNTPGTHYLDLWESLGETYGYQLNVQTFTTEELKDKLRISLVCGELPDIFAVWGGSFPRFLFDAGACLPVQDYIRDSGLSFADGYLSTYTDGNTYIIPCLVEAYAITYANTNLMEQMDLQIPETWDELIALTDAVNTYNQDHGTAYVPVGFGNKDSWLGELLYTMIVNREDPYAFDRLRNHQETFDDSNDVFTDAAYKILQLKEHQAFAPEFMQTGEVESVENFVSGNTVLLPHQSTIIYYLMEHMGEDGIRVFQFPDCSGGKYPDYETYLMNANDTMTPGLCINSAAPYPEDAAKICLDFSRQVNQINVTEYGYLNYMNDDQLTLPDDLPQPVLSFRDMVENARHCTSFWYATLPREEAKSWQNLTKKLYAGVLSPDEFTDAAQGCLIYP